MEIWDLRNGKRLSLLKGHAGFIAAHAFTPDGERIATSSMDKTLKLWDIQSGQELLTFALKDLAVEMDFSPDGSYLGVRTAQGGRVVVWDGKGEAEDR
jgi:WD40 repeat protein